MHFITCAFLILISNLTISPRVLKDDFPETFGNIYLTTHDPSPEPMVSKGSMGFKGFPWVSNGFDGFVKGFYGFPKGSKNP